MNARTTWKAAVESAGTAVEALEQPVGGHSSARYPLLGDTPSTSPAQPLPSKAWRLRLDLSLAEHTLDWTDEELAFVLEDIDELEVGSERDPRLLGPTGIPLIAPEALALDSGGRAHLLASDWTSCSSPPGGALTPLLDGNWQRTLLKTDGSKLEELAFECDRVLLKNIAIIGRRAADLRDDQSATLILDGSDTQEPEELVGETLRALVGVFSGVSTIAVRAHRQEDCQRLAWRVNILRLLKWEADLGALQHPFEGAPFFEELRSRLFQG